MGDEKKIDISALRRISGWYDDEAGVCYDTGTFSHEGTIEEKQSTTRVDAFTLFDAPELCPTTVSMLRRSSAAQALHLPFVARSVALKRTRNQSAPFRFWHLFMGCGGIVDRCEPFDDGTCQDVQGFPQISVAADLKVPFNCDLAGVASQTLSTLSVANNGLFQGLRDISFVEIDEKGQYIVDGSGKNSHSIEINPGMLEDDVKDLDDYLFVITHRICHEIGHHLYHHVLEFYCPGWREEFSSISAQAYGDFAEHRDDFLNSQAALNADEDLAVCVAYFITLPEAFRKQAMTSAALQAKYDFLLRIFNVEFDDA